MDDADICIERWLLVMRWRRRVESELRKLNLSLAQWLALESLHTLFRETRDAVSQVQVARRLELDKATISQIMDRLVERGLIDRAPEYPGHAWRIYLTARGKRALEQGRAMIEAVSTSQTQILAQAKVPEPEKRSALT